MKTTALTLPWLCLIACALLGGCTETRFQALPDVALKSCDARWKGLWVPREEPEGNSAFYVDDACNFTVFDHADSGGPIKRVPFRVKFAHVRGQDLMFVADHELESLVEIDPVYGVNPAPKQAYFYVRYDVHKDHVAVYPVDSERIATRIIHGKLKGTVSKTSNQLRVFVSGNRTRMHEILRGESVFAAKPDFVLVRSQRPVSDFERLVGKPTHSNDE